MKRIMKLVSVALGLIGTLMMLFTQVTVEWFTGNKESIAFKALVGGTYPKAGTTFEGVPSGLAGYILVGAGALIVLLTVLIPFFKEHDVLSAVVTGLGVVCMIVGTILIFLIRKNFDNSSVFKTVYVGWGAMVGGSCASLAAASGALGMIFDLSGTN